MKPVFQTVFDFEHGDCMRACVASIFELSIEEVPNFNEPDSSHFEENLEEWCNTQEIKAISITCDDENLLKDCWVIAIGQSPRSKNKEYKHAIVWYNKKMVHDPYPNGIGIIGKPEAYNIFIIKNPVQQLKNDMKTNEDLIAENKELKCHVKALQNICTFSE